MPQKWLIILPVYFILRRFFPDFDHAPWVVGIAGVGTLLLIVYLVGMKLAEAS